MLLFVLHAPSLELKPLPDHLKYVYLGKDETLPVIIANNMFALQEEQLIRVLVDHRTIIGWTIVNIKRISPFLCMHRILLDDDAKPTREPRRGLTLRSWMLLRKKY